PCAMCLRVTLPVRAARRRSPRMHSFRSSLFALVTVSVVAIGCGSATTAGGTTTPQTALNVPPPNAHAQIVSSDDDAGGTAQEVFERAKTEMQLGGAQAGPQAAPRLEHARVLFDRVVAADRAEQPQGNGPSALRRAAMYGA